MFDPEPSLPPPCYPEPQFEPTDDGEPEPAPTDEPSPRSLTALSIALEPEPRSSVQVCELAVRHVMVEVSVGSKGVEESLLNIHADMPCLLLPSSSVCSTATTEVIIELSVCLELSERRN